MDKTVPSNDYERGQMMGMLCIIRMILNAKDTQTFVPISQLEKIERTATKSLAGYFQIPEEDVILLVDKSLGNI